MKTEDTESLAAHSRRGFFKTTGLGLGMVAATATGIAGVANAIGGPAKKPEEPASTEAVRGKKQTNVNITTIPMTIGDDVICVDDTPNKRKSGRKTPDGKVVKGEVYTITDITKSGDLVIRCKRVVNPKKMGASGWRKDRFRLLTEEEKALNLA